MDCGGPVSQIAWSPDGTRIVTEGDGAATTIWESATGHLLRTIPGLVRVAGWGAGGKTLAGIDLGDSAGVWDAETGRPLWTRKVHRMRDVRSAPWSPDGRFLVAMGQIWDSTSGRPIRRVPGNDGQPIHAGFSPDGRSFAILAPDLRRIEEAESGRLIARIPAEPARALAWSPDGRRIAAAELNEVGI